MMNDDRDNIDAESDRVFLSTMLLNIRIAQEQSSACATLLQRAADALAKNRQTLAMNDILEAEPLLYEAHVLLNAISIVKRNADRM